MGKSDNEGEYEVLWPDHVNAINQSDSLLCRITILRYDNSTLSVLRCNTNLCFSSGHIGLFQFDLYVFVGNRCIFTVKVKLVANTTEYSHRLIHSR
jgi:hypothetical protein